MLRRASILAALGIAALGPVISTASSSGSPPTRRTYTGHSVGTTGHYDGASGRAHVALALVRTGEEPDPPFVPLVEYAVTIKVEGFGCATSRRSPARRCLSIKGTLAGNAEDLEKQIGDAAKEIRITSASGRLRPMGTVTASGTLAGTGFVAKGARTLALTIKAHRGTVQLNAEGPPIGGFAAP